MDTFDHLLNWKLKRGSHEFPGRDGGTCINEAALVAAGFDYKPISHVGQMPGCFSRPICRLAMLLNDQADDEERQRLLPYVTRLACADAAGVEKERQHSIDQRSPYCSINIYPFGVIGPSFEVGLRTLDAALAIGRQADPLGFEEVSGRLERAKTGRPVSPAMSGGLFSKAGLWLSA